MWFLNVPPLGDQSNTTLYILLGVAVVCVVALGALWLIPKRSKDEEENEEEHVEEINEE